MASDISARLQDWSRGRPGAFDEVLDLSYRELKCLAGRAMATERPDHTLQATGLVHEAWLRLRRLEGVSWSNRAQFFGLVGRMMRRILVDHARRRSAGKRGAGRLQPLQDLDEPTAACPQTSLLVIDEALAGLRRVDPFKASIVARPSTLAYRMSKALRRNLAATVVTALVLGVLVVSSIVVAVQSRRLAQERDRAEAERRASDEMLGMLVAAFDADPSEELSARQVLEANRRRAESVLADDPELQARAFRVMGVAYDRLGLYDQALAIDARLHELDRRMGAARTRYQEAYRSLQQIKGDLARETLETKQRLDALGGDTS